MMQRLAIWEYTNRVQKIPRLHLLTLIKQLYLQVIFHQRISQILRNTSKTIYPPGGNKRYTLFFRLLLALIFVYADFCITNVSLITRLTLKISAIQYEFSLKKFKICVIYSHSIVKRKLYIDRIIHLIMIFFKNSYIFGISMKF